MGTSSHNNGQKGNTPLVPTWLDQPDEKKQLDPAQNDINPVPIGELNRFTQPRREFTRYINSAGQDIGIVRKSIANYIRNSMGGSKNATQRLGAAKKSSEQLWKVAGIFASGGAKAVEHYFLKEHYLSLKNLAQKNATDALIAIADFICPAGGPQDEGIARNAYISAIEETPDIALIPFEELTIEQLLLIVQKTMANVVYGRIINDIGNKIIMLPQNIEIAEKLVKQIKELIYVAISDAISDLNIETNNLSQDQSKNIVNNVYQTAFKILEKVGNIE